MSAALQSPSSVKGNGGPQDGDTHTIRKLDPTTETTKAMNAASYDALAATYLSFTQEKRASNITEVIVSEGRGSSSSTSASDPGISNPQPKSTPIPITNPRLHYLHSHLLLLLSRSAQVLELGCGAGVPVLQILARHLTGTARKDGEDGKTGRLVGVDSSAVQIGLARGYVEEWGRDGEGGEREGGHEEGKGEGNGGGHGDGAGAGYVSTTRHRIGTPDKNENSNDGSARKSAGTAATAASGNDKLNPTIDLIAADMTALSFPAGSFDAVVAFYSLIHLPREEQGEMIAKVALWLDRPSVNEDETSITNTKGGGYFLFNLGTRDNPGSYAKEWLGCKEGHMYWSGFDTVTNLKMVEEKFNILEAAVVEDEEDGGKIVPFLWILAQKK